MAFFVQNYMYSVFRLRAHFAGIKSPGAKICRSGVRSPNFVQKDVSKKLGSSSQTFFPRLIFLRRCAWVKSASGCHGRIWAFVINAVRSSASSNNFNFNFDFNSLLDFARGIKNLLFSCIYIINKLFLLFSYQCNATF